MAVPQVLGNVSALVEMDAGVISFVEEFGVDVGEPCDTDVDVSPPPSRLLESILCTNLLPGPESIDTDVHRVLRYLAGRGVCVNSVAFEGLGPQPNGASLRSIGFRPLHTLDKDAHRCASLALFAFIASKSPLAAEAVVCEFRQLICARVRSKSM